MSEIKFYNTFTKSLEVFKTLVPGKVKIYTCGPTVYSHPHIGNYRSFLMADVLKRFLKLKGYDVYHVMNITDVGHLLDDADEGEDKIEQEARKQKKDPLEIAQIYIDSFNKANKLLNVSDANVYPKATDHINEMIEIIKSLVDKGFAYVVDKNVYYDVSKFSNYGKLSGNTLDELNAGARVEVNEEKKHPFDFALWKHDPKHLQQWDSPWGRGFPGWHIECSAMSSKYLGPEFDIHTGGEDNIFPHHECEIAQSEAASDRKFVHFWIHARHLMVDGEKMSKSKGNFYTINDLIEKGFDKKSIRYVLISSHYRQNCNFTFDGLKAAEQAIQKLNQFVFVMTDIIENSGGEGEIRDEINVLSQKALSGFEDALADDLNISKALACVFDFIKDSNKISDTNKKEAEFLRDTLYKIDSVLGVLEEKEDTIPEEIIKLAEDRKAAKKSKNYQLADEIRNEILAKNYVIEDIPGGYRIKKKGE